jgi:DNA recombination protein RmuC
MNNLKDGTRKGNTIIGRFETIKKLEAKTNKSIHEKHLREIELLPDDDEVIILDTGTNNENSVPDL